MAEIWPVLQEHHIALFAISYDSVEQAAAFGAKYGVQYPLLCDQGSEVIKRLGMYNQHVVEQQAFYGRPASTARFGIPYPGIFLLDENGVIIEKRFEQSYRVRPTPAGVLEDILSIESPTHGPEFTAATDAVTVHAYLDAPGYKPYKQLLLTLDVTIDAGWHVYGEPVPEGFIPLSVTVEPVDGLEVGAMRWPQPHRWAMEGIDDEFWVYEGAVRGVVPLTFARPAGAGNLVVTVRVEYQACNDMSCLMPAELTFDFPLGEEHLLPAEH